MKLPAKRATIDFETRSACSLKKHGTWRYSIHSSTQILCLVYRLPHWKVGRTEVWHPAYHSFGLDETPAADHLGELFDWVMSGGLVEAHNVWFEFCMWRNIMVRKYGWPDIAFPQWRCSAAKAAAHALPRGLDEAGAALKLALRKDVEGAKVMKKMRAPRKSRKKERLEWAAAGVKPPKYLWHESLELHARLVEYCRVDVLAEEALSHVIPDLHPIEQELFEMDLRINDCGFQLDKQAVAIAGRLLFREALMLNLELRKLTNGAVQKATQRDRLLEWLESEGTVLDNTQKATLDELLSQKEDDDELPPWVPQLNPKTRRAIEILRALGRSSTAKYQAMVDWMAPDGRVRGGLLFHGASTGRWSGKGIQPHNFPKGTEKDYSMADLWEALLTGNQEVIASIGKGVMETLSNALRGAIVATKGYDLYIADYSSIEARVLLWVAGDDEALDIFRQHRDIYCEMASSIYDRPVTKDDKEERSMGKIAVLGLGYQMGVGKFQSTCATFGIDIEEDFARVVVDAYRTKFWRVKQLWADQEDAAMQAVTSGKRVFAGKVAWFTEGRFLYCQLPSGRRLAYPYPEVQTKVMPWGGQADGLTFMGVDSYTHQWKRLTTYGGMIVENIVQAISRDLMAWAMLRAQQEGVYRVILSVHDELVAEAPKGQGSVPQFEQLMAECPDWAADCPVEAAGWKGYRYAKG